MCEMCIHMYICEKACPNIHYIVSSVEIGELLNIQVLRVKLLGFKFQLSNKLSSKSYYSLPGKGVRKHQSHELL